MRSLLLSLLLCALSAPARAGKEQKPVGQRTYWDQLMEHQAARSLYRGGRYMRAGDYDRAVKEYAKSVIADPESPDTHRMLGVAYYWSGQVDQAEAEFDESLRLGPDSAQTHLLLGIVHAWKGDIDKAYAFFLDGARLDPGRPDIQMNIGSIEESRGRFADALTRFRKAAELDKENPLYHFQLGMLYGRLGRYGESVDSLRRAIKIFPHYEDAMLELGAVYERMGELKDARRMFEKSVRLKKRDSVARLRLARIYLRSGEREKAWKVLRHVFHLTPSDSKGGLALSVSYGGPRKAGESPGESREGGKESAQPQGPLDLLRRNLARIPLDQDAVLHADVAFLPKPKLVRKAPGEQASKLKSALERAGKLPGGSVLGARRDFELRSADAEARAKEIARITDDLKKVLDSAPPDSETRLGMNLSFSEKPAVPDSSGQPRGKVAYQPRDVGNDLGLWVMGTGWMRLVEEVLTPPGEEMKEDSADWWVVEGIGNATMGRARSAADAFERALELDPDSELAHLGLGVARVISGDEEGAAQAYRRALALNPKNKTASEGLKWLLRKPATEEAAGGEEGGQ